MSYDAINAAEDITHRVLDLDMSDQEFRRFVLTRLIDAEQISFAPDEEMPEGTRVEAVTSGGDEQVIGIIQTDFFDGDDALVVFDHLSAPVPVWRNVLHPVVES